VLRLATRLKQSIAAWLPMGCVLLCHFQIPPFSPAIPPFSRSEVPVLGDCRSKRTSPPPTPEAFSALSDLMHWPLFSAPVPEWLDLFFLLVRSKPRSPLLSFFAHLNELVRFPSGPSSSFGRSDLAFRFSSQSPIFHIAIVYLT